MTFHWDDDVMFTSDPHLGHARAAISRGFVKPDGSADIDAHDRAVMDSITQAVSPRTTLFWLGDLSGGSASGTAGALSLISTITTLAHVLVSGNHDRSHPMSPYLLKVMSAFMRVFLAVQSVMTVDVIFPDGTRRRILLSHFPYSGDAAYAERDRGAQWRPRDSGLWLLHGHTHRESQRQHDGRQIHVGWDAWRGPVPLSEIVRIIQEHEREDVPDHDA